MAIEQFIDNEVKANDVVLFMKGTPQFPQCGFSGQVVQILDHLGVAYKGLNVLENDDLRDGIKAYSNWPTIPQLYVKGEFVGGCDIVREMFQAGELQSLLKDKGVAVKESLRRSRLRHASQAGTAGLPPAGSCDPGAARARRAGVMRPRRVSRIRHAWRPERSAPARSRGRSGSARMAAANFSHIVGDTRTRTTPEPCAEDQINQDDGQDRRNPSSTKFPKKLFGFVQNSPAWQHASVAVQHKRWVGACAPHPTLSQSHCVVCREAAPSAQAIFRA